MSKKLGFMTQLFQTKTKIEYIQWNIHEIIEPPLDGETTRIDIYSTDDGHQYVPVRFFGYEYWLNPLLWGGDIATNDILRLCFVFANERASRNIVLPSLRADDLFIDVGASYGSWTLPAAAMGANVFAFEPDFYSASVLLTHIKLNKFEKRVSVGQEFVGAKPTNSLDRHKNKFDKLKLIKIDTEGSELDVLKGAKKTINKYKPNILTELHTQIHGKTPDEFIKFMTDFYPKIPYRHYISSQKSREQDEEYFHIYSYL